MKKPLSLIKSSFRDIRCCDETSTDSEGVSLGFRALVSSMTCVLDGSGHNTGYVHVSQLEQYNTATGAPTGVTKDNTPSDVNYIADYINTSMCAVAEPEPTTAILYAYNHCSGVLSIRITRPDSTYFDLYVNPEGTISQIIPVNTYSVTLQVEQVSPPPPAPHLSVQQTVSGQTYLVASNIEHTFVMVTGNININVKPTTTPG